MTSLRSTSHDFVSDILKAPPPFPGRQIQAELARVQFRLKRRRGQAAVIVIIPPVRRHSRTRSNAP